MDNWIKIYTRGGYNPVEVLRDDEQYYKIENYSMKCRLYPNKENKQKIDLAIQGIQTFYNCTLYEMFKNQNLVREVKKKDDDENIVHFPDFKAAGSVQWKEQVIGEHPIISYAPSSAITCKSGVVTDLKKSLGKLPIEYQSPRFYNKKNPRRSYSYQDSYNKIKSTENRNVLLINLAKIGICKVRGWNKRIRFDEEGSVDFSEFCERQAKERKQVTVTIEKDNCGDYWIVFKLSCVYKPMLKSNDKVIGIDVGVKDIIITSDGVKYENKKVKKQQESHIDRLQKQLSRRKGFSNIKFREEYKKDKSLVVSNRYKETQLKLSKLHRKIERKRRNYNHCITSHVVGSNNFIGVESLNVKGMFKNHCLANALSDAAIGNVLEMIQYKSNWYGRIIQPIGQWEPSSKKCNCCGYILPKLSLSTREWTCPQCGSRHDRDINASKNIRDIAYKMYAS